MEITTAQTGKKINELTALSTVSDQTVLPAVYVQGTTTNATANKISISQISTKVQQDLSDTLANKQDRLTAGTGIDITNNTISCDVEALPSQTGNAGKFLTTDGTDAAWATVDALPSQTGQSGKFLTTNGTVASWATVQAGGGAPTLTWYTGNTGSTVTIADTSSATLVKIYKNGILLQPTEDYSISGTTLTLVSALESQDKITTEVFA